MKTPELALVGDVGGTNLRIGVATIDRETGRAVMVDQYENVSTPNDPDLFFHAMGDAIFRKIELFPELRDGAVGFPGPVDIQPNGTTVGPLTNIAFKEKFNLGERLVAAHPGLSGFDFHAFNDAEAATFAAPFVPGVSNPENPSPIVYVTQSTGIGMSVIREHQIAERLTGWLGEYGHIPMLQPDGSYETLENLISGPAIERRYGLGADGEHRTVQDLGKLTTPEGKKIWEEVGRTFARGIAPLIPIIAPSDLVIGGGVSKDGDQYLKFFMDELQSAVSSLPKGMDTMPTVSFVPPKEVGTFGLIGARHALEQARKS